MILLYNFLSELEKSILFLISFKLVSVIPYTLSIKVPTTSYKGAKLYVTFGLKKYSLIKLKAIILSICNVTSLET